jgi:hypothetical protein
MIEGPITKGIQLDPQDHLKVIKALITVMEGTGEPKPSDTEVKQLAGLLVAKSIGEIISDELDALADKLGYQWKDGERTSLERKLAVVIELWDFDTGRHRGKKL